MFVTTNREIDDGPGMMNLTEEQLDAWDADLKRQEKMLEEHGWKRVYRPETNKWSGEIYDALFWEDPFGNPHPYSNGYDQLTLVLLREKGWRKIIEVKHCGKKEWNKEPEKWGRYQSPDTKRVYTFLDAQYIMEQGWNESCYPENCCGSTKLLNKLLGEDFKGDAIETWLHRNEQDELVLEWWTD